MRTLAEVEKDIELVQRRLDLHTEIQRIQWRILSALKKPDSDLDECSRNLDKFQDLIAELEDEND